MGATINYLEASSEQLGIILEELRRDGQSPMQNANTVECSMVECLL
jgi:hypothetical protein